MELRLGLEDTVVGLQHNRLHWYGHVLWKDDNKWVRLGLLII